MRKGTTILQDWTNEAHTFVRVTPDIMIRLDTDGTIGWTNPAWMKTLGYPSSDSQGKSLLHFIHPEDVGLLNEAIRSLSTDDLNRRVRFRMLKHGGGFVWIDARGAYFNDRKRAYLTLRDATESAMYEEALKQSSQEMDSYLLGHGAWAVAQVDARGTIVYQSRYSKNVIGYDHRDLLGRNAFELVHPDDLPYAQSLFAGLLNRPGESTFGWLRWLHAPDDEHARPYSIRLAVFGINLLENRRIESIIVFYWNAAEP